METRIAELRYKEVISVEDGARYGYVGDGAGQNCSFKHHRSSKL